MKYQPSGYSWLGICPATKKEREVEKLEEEVIYLSKSYEEKGDEKILRKIKEIKKKIKSLESKRL